MTKDELKTKVLDMYWGHIGVVKVLTAVDEFEQALLQQTDVMRRFRVNMLHRGKERWKYCRTIERAKKLQQEATAGGLCSIIYEKGDKGYVAWNGA